MPVSSLVHPTALVSPEAELSPDVEVGPYSVIEGRVRAGPGCVLGPRVHLVGPLTLGRDNHVHSGAVLGEWPQHLKYRGEPTSVEVGDGNCFFDRVTVHRAATPGFATRIGSGNVFNAGSHVGHDSQVGDGCTFRCNALVGGHCLIGNGAWLGEHTAVHQFCRLGRLAVLEPTSIATKDVPPFIVHHGVNSVAGPNLPGLQRAGLGAAEVDAFLRTYEIVYLRGLTIPVALVKLAEELGQWQVVAEFIAFVRECSRGISTHGGQPLRKAA